MVGMDATVDRSAWGGLARVGSGRMSKVIQRPRQSLRTVDVVQFGSPTSQAIAARIEALLSQRSVKARTTTFEADPTARGSGDHLVLVFPIRGDERIPDQVESWIRSTVPGVAHSLWVTGDFRAGEPCDRVAAEEATRLLSERGSPALIPPVLLDTPVAEDELDHVVGAWVARLLEPVIELPGHSDAPDPEPGDRRQAPRPDDVAEDALRGIVARLPIPPRVELDADGRCVSLSLTDGARYERGLLAGLPPRQIRAVLDLVAELSRLDLFGIPYSGLAAVDVRLPASVTKVDLRGNRLATLAFLADQEAVAFVNLADCDLAEVPDVLSSLPRLHTLVLGKNRLVSIPGWFGRLRSLRRVTTYRNMLTEIRGLAGLPNLELLNIGASPLRLTDGDLHDLPGLEVLGLRLLGLDRIPASVWRLPRLRLVDVSKNPVAVSPPSHPRVRFVERMPTWAWDRPGIGPS